MKPQLKRPSLALTLLILLVIAFVLGDQFKRYAALIQWLTIGLGVCYAIVGVVLRKRSFLQVRLKTVILYLLFFCFALFRWAYHGRGLKTVSPQCLKSSDSCMMIAEFCEGDVRKGEYSPLIFELKAILTPQKRFLAKEKLMVIYFQDSQSVQLQLGDVIGFSNKTQSIENSSNPGAFDAVSYWGNNGITRQLFLRSDECINVSKKTRWRSIFYHWRAKLGDAFEKALTPKEAGIAKALVLGDKSSLDKSVKEDFTAAGAMHVLAVSGLHVGILLFCLQFFFQKIPFLRKKQLYYLVALVVLWIYALLTGFSPSVVRATTMFTFLVFGKLRGEGMFSLEVLLSTAFLMLLLSPSYLLDIGFQLSFSAMFSIALFFEGITGVFQFGNKIVRKIWEGTALCFAAQIGTLPLCLYYFHQFPNYFLLTNIMLLVMAFAAMFSGLLYLLTFFIPVLNDLTVEVLKVTFETLSFSIEKIAGLPYALTQGIHLGIGSVLTIYLLCFSMYLSLKTRRMKFVMVLGIMFVPVLARMNMIREETIRQRRAFILESKGPAVLFSSMGKHIVVYEKANKALHKEFGFIAKSYQQLYGGEFFYYPLEQQELEFSNAKVGVTADSLYYLDGENELYFSLGEKVEKCLEIRLP